MKLSKLKKLIKEEIQKLQKPLQEQYSDLSELYSACSDCWSSGGVFVNNDAISTGSSANPEGMVWLPISDGEGGIMCGDLGSDEFWANPEVSTECLRGCEEIIEFFSGFASGLSGDNMLLDFCEKGQSPEYQGIDNYWTLMLPSLLPCCKEKLNPDGPVDPIVDPCEGFESYVLDNFPGAPGANSIDEFCAKCEAGSIIDDYCDCCPIDPYMSEPRDKQDWLDMMGLGDDSGPGIYKPETPPPAKPIFERLQKLAGIKKSKK
jgi:hypothetical protein